MGYTHYWSFVQPRPLKKKQAENELNYQLALRQIKRLVKRYNQDLKSQDEKHPDRLAGTTPHTEMNDYLGVDFNGTGELGHETFYLSEHFSKNEPFNFCKTANKPYDKVVVASLIILNHYLGESVHVSSDGNASDWEEGLALAKSILKMKSLKIPDGVIKLQDEAVS